MEWDNSFNDPKNYQSITECWKLISHNGNSSELNCNILYLGQDSPDKCPMPINADQNCAIDPNADQV